MDKINDEMLGGQCVVCGIEKRPDIYHCRDCDACVEGHDHHCGVVGVCIGDPNFKYFAMFQVYAGICMIFMGVSHTRFNNSIIVEEEKMRRKTFQLVVVGVCYVFAGIVILMGLGFFY